MEIVIGIVAGLLTSVVLALFRKVIYEWIIPWYRLITYKGLSLQGSWFRVANSQKTLLEIKQECERLTGKATASSFHQNKGLHIDDIRTFDLEGYIYDRFVIITLKNTDRSRLGVVSFLLQIDGDGTCLKGASSWYAPLVSSIEFGEMAFFRSEQRASEGLAKDESQR
ncbi:hypothetical protein [Rhodanobacter soli]|uniref:hypothetical protein n=1 Tax=Rhodanobacter soli TaxID=590609 RepID=UPI0031D74C41